MLIRAQLNDIPDSLNFILDTGSGGISLDSAILVEHPRVPIERRLEAPIPSYLERASP